MKQDKVIWEKCRGCKGFGHLFGMIHIPCGGTGKVKKITKKGKK